MRSDWTAATLRSVFLVLLLLVAGWPGSAYAQEPGGVFDDDDEGAKPTQPRPRTDGEQPVDPEKQTRVGDRDTIGFTQENAASQMRELEERMFRLSEALRSLEPENASRLKLALKFSREELILQQMREMSELLSRTQLTKAEAETRVLLAKLEHLRDLLLAENLDFQLKLARLRQMRETLGQLERIIQEERREHSWSRSANEAPARQEGLEARTRKLEALIAAQKQVLEKTGKHANTGANQPDRPRAGDLRDSEEAVRLSARELASDPESARHKPNLLAEAGPFLDAAVDRLANAESQAALDDEQQALDRFQKELDRTRNELDQLNENQSKSEFERQQQAQSRNRAATNALSAASARLGDTGVAVQKELIRASVSMESAEGDLSRTEADPAARDQKDAIDALTKGAEGLAQAQEALLVELRTELQNRLIAELTEMHEAQMSIRETTESQAERAARKSRAALIALAGLGKQELAMAEQTDQLVALVEETEFGIALPTALRVVAREMRAVENLLRAGDASARTVIRETRIEEDLLALLQAMRRLPPTTPPRPGTPLPSDLREREKELNRLVAELKMIRMLQARLNDDTHGLDESRSDQPTLSDELVQEIQSLGVSQEEIQKSLGRIAERMEGPEF